MTTNTLQLDLTGSSDEEMNSILGAACHLGEVDPEVDIQIRVSGSALNKLFHMNTSTVEPPPSAKEETPEPDAPKKNTRFRMTNAEKDAGLSLEQAKEFRAQADETGITLSQFCDSVGLGEEKETAPETETETPNEPAASEETAAPETETPPAEPDLEYDRDIKARVAKALGAGADRTALKKLAKKHGGETFKDVDPSNWPAVIDDLEAMIAESGDIA